MEMMKAASFSSENQRQKQKVQEFEREEVRGRRSFHVLAVDDSHIERKILEKLLTVSSYQVTSVESGDKALEYLGLLDSPASCEPVQGHGMRVNLIMTDYSMPGMSGYDLLKRVKGSSWRDVPVIVMSSENVPSRIHMCLEEGAEEFLLKPVRLSDLMKLQAYVARSATCRCCVDDSNADDSEIGIGGIGGNTGKEFCDNIEETIVEREILL